MWHKAPFVRFLAALIVGIIAAMYSAISLPFCVLPLCALLVLATWYWTKRKVGEWSWLFGGVMFLLLIGIGYERAYWNDGSRSDLHFQHCLEEENQLLGWVSEIPTTNNWVRVKLRMQETNEQASTGTLLLYLASDTASQALRYGDLLLLDARVSAIESAKNPDAFDFKAYSYFKDIHHQAFVRAGDWKRLEGNYGNPVLEYIFELRLYLLDVLQQYLTTEETLAVGSALILGYRADLSDELRTAYAETGAIHVLAVSGLHVGVIYMMLNFLFRAFPKNSKRVRAFRIVFSLMAIWFFALITGASPSVMRAATMFSFILGGQYFERTNNIYNNLAAAAFFTLLFNPFLLFDLGFQLSYSAVLGIVFFQPKLVKFWKPNNRISKYFWELMTVSIAAQLAVSPISLFYFHQFPLYFWLSSSVVIPAAFAILSGGLLLFATHLIAELAEWIGYGLDLLIWCTNGAIFYIQTLPGGLVRGIWLETHELILLYAVVASLVGWGLTQRFRWLLGGLFGLVLILGSQAYQKIQLQEQQKVVIYNTNKATLIDCFDGRTVYSLQSSGLKEKTEQFAAKQHRWSRQVANVKTLALNDTTSVATDRWLYHRGFMQFGEMCLAIPQKLKLPPPDTPIAVDYVLAQANLPIDLEKLHQYFEFDTLLLDASISYRQSLKWQQECADQNINYYDLRAAGAWELVLEE